MLTFTTIHPLLTQLLTKVATNFIGVCIKSERKMNTLLEAIATLLRLNAGGRSENFNFGTHDTHSSLYEELRAVRADLGYTNAFFRAESFYYVASEVDRIAREDHRMLDSYGGVSLHGQSHGESFMSLFTNRLKGKGLYISDKPEAALSYINQLRFLAWMKQATDAGSQIIISTHSPVILAYPDAATYVAEEGELKPTSYDDYYIYRDMQAFITNKDLVIKEFFGKYKNIKRIIEKNHVSLQIYT